MIPTVSATELAHRIADAVLGSAIVVNDQATWLAPAYEWSNDHYELVHLTGDPTLYDGSAGIALACAMVAEALRRDDLLGLAVQAARHSVGRAHEVAHPGLYDGLAGIGLAALSTGLRARDQGLETAGIGILESIDIMQTEASDLISGLTGLALAYLRAAELTRESRWLDLAKSAADRVVELAARFPWGWAWPNDDGQALCGLAHGSAGPAWVLAEVAQASNQRDRYQQAVDSARQYERSWFDPRTNSWPDLRRETQVTSVSELPRPALWCHGSVGIGISRLGIDAVQPHPALKAEVASALQSACAAAVDQIHAGSVEHGLTVCHGLGGTLEFLIDAADHFGEPTHLQTARWILDMAVHLLGSDPGNWPGGILQHPSPGFMNGLAGTMAVLVRLSEPDSIPPVGRLGFVEGRYETEPIARPRLEAVAQGR